MTVIFMGRCVGSSTALRLQKLWYGPDTLRKTEESVLGHGKITAMHIITSGLERSRKWLGLIVLGEAGSVYAKVWRNVTK